MKKLMYPSIGLMNRLSLKFKFFLIVGLLLVPVIGLSFITQSNFNKELYTSYQQKEGLGVVSASTKVLLVADELVNSYLRRQNNPLAASHSNFKQVQADFIEHLSRLERMVQNLEYLYDFEPERFQAIINAAYLLIKSTSNSSNKEVYKAHSELVAQILHLNSEMGFGSHLFSIKDVEMAHLVDTYTRQMPELFSNIGQLRQLGERMEKNNVLSSELRERMIIFADRIEYLHERMEFDLVEVEIKYPELTASFAKEDELLHTFIDQTRRFLHFEESTVTITSEEYLAHVEKVLRSSEEFFTGLVPIIENVIDEKIGGNQWINHAIVLMVVGGISLLIYLLAGFYLSFIGSLNALKESAEQVAAGNLTHKINIDAKDEMGQIGHAMMMVSDGVSRTVLSVVHTSQLFTEVASRLAISSEITENSVSSQVRDSEDTSRSISELSNTVSSVTSNIEQAADAARQAKELTHQGHQVVTDVIASVDALASDIDRVAEVIASLSKESEQITGILEMIREIADQTNLLALNAAIEAARAGDHGRGFAVVADEVRNLAQKTHHATVDIQSMIEKLSGDSHRAVEVMHSSEQQLANTVEQAKKADEALNEITNLVASISDMNSRIAISAEHQSEMAKVLDNNVINMTSAASQAANVARSNVEDASIIRSLACETQSQINRFLIDDELIKRLEQRAEYVLFKWDDSFSVNIPEIDRQHQILVGMLNELHEHVKRKSNIMFIKRVLQGLISYTDSHFTYEEGLLERFQYPDIEEHKKKHRKLIGEVKGFQERLENDEHFPLGEVMQFLTEWLMHHIKGSDIEYSRDILPKMAESHSSPKALGGADDVFDDDSIDLF